MTDFYLDYIQKNKNYEDNSEEPKFFVKLINKNYDDAEPKRPSLKLLIDKLKEKYINKKKLLIYQVIPLQIDIKTDNRDTSKIILSFD